MGHVVTENRHGLVVAAQTTLATGTAEREASVAMMKRLPRGRRATLGGDKGYDTQAHVQQLRELGVTPHVAQNDKRRRSAIDDRTTTHVGYEISQRKRKAVEQVFGWGKTVGPIRKTKHRGKRACGLDVHLHPGGLQSRADEELAMPDVARRSARGIAAMTSRIARAERRPIRRLFSRGNASKTLLCARDQRSSAAS